MNQQRASKKLIVCCDGTWNWPEQKGGPTNVIKMVRAISPADRAGTPQVVYYHPGVGTGNFIDRIMGGSFGIGLSRNVQDAYQFLVNNYQSGDEIYLFGFSRGAFTVRSLAGLIGCVGLLRKGDMDQFPSAYAYYKTPPPQREKVKAALLGELREVRYPDIHMVGVWDTVGALGVPFGLLRWIGQRLYNFHDTTLGKKVRHGYHALAIDEQRRPFRPAIWNKQANDDDPKQVLEQVWFAGAHSNVGGGYPDRGLSDHAFLWMVAKAMRCGLQIDAAYIKEKIALELQRSKYLLVNSRTLQYRIWPRLIRQMCTTRNGFEKVHQTVLNRRNAPPPGTFQPYPYKPPNLSDLEQRHPSLDGLIEQTPAETLAELLKAQAPPTPADEANASRDARDL